MFVLYFFINVQNDLHTIVIVAMVTKFRNLSILYDFLPWKPQLS